MNQEKTLSQPSFWKSDFTLMGLFALLNIILHLVAINGFGYFRDELYYIACSDHLAWGYVDQPPLSVFLLKIVRFLFGDSRLALRILPALASGTFVFMTGWMTRKLGGGRFAILLASAAAFSPIGNFFLFHFYSMNFWDFLFWQACILIIIHIIQTRNMKLWLLFGLVAGLGLQNKISVLFLGFGLGVGLLLTQERRCLKEKQFWLGLLIAGLAFLPYIIWNAVHDWPLLEFMHNARTYKMTAVSPMEFISGQILYQNPANIVIWMAGLLFYFIHPKGKSYRTLGWMFLSIFVLLMVQQAKDYYAAAAYPIVFAGGGLMWESLLKKKSVRWIKPVMIALPVISALLLCPITLPVLSVEKTIGYIQSLGVEGNSGERHEMGSLPQHFADQHGWPEMAHTVFEVYQTLTPEEKSKCLIYVRNYGEAGAIDFFGQNLGLPKATCAHNNYWFWGLQEGRTGEVAIIRGSSKDIDESRADLEEYFDSVEFGATFTHPYCMPYENNSHFFICRGFHGSFEDIWESQKHFN